MALLSNREPFVPLRTSELVEALCAEEGFPRTAEQPFRQLCRLLTALHHLRSHQLLEQLKNAYAPFDPDRFTSPLIRLSGEEKQQQLNALFNDFSSLMQRANFKHLSRTDMEPALQGPS